MPHLTPEQRFWSKVEKTDTCWNWTGKLSHGYGRFLHQGKYGGSIQAHRYSWKIAHGTIADDAVVDHICHNKRCVRPTHLRLATVSQNIQHRKGPQANNTSGHRGVTWDARRKVWAVQVYKAGKRVYQASFADLDEAADAARAARAKHHDFPEYAGR